MTPATAAADETISRLEAVSSPIRDRIELRRAGRVIAAGLYRLVEESPNWSEHGGG